MVDRFSKYHPLVNFLYFALVIGFSMALNHPLSQGISFACAAIYGVQTEGKKAVLSIMVTWALENAIETADSMKSRGYGLKGRTAFSIYRFDDRDRMSLLYLGFCGFYLLAGYIVSAFGFRYFPSIRYIGLNAVTLFFSLFISLCV